MDGKCNQDIEYCRFSKTVNVNSPKRQCFSGELLASINVHNFAGTTSPCEAKADKKRSCVSFL